MSVSQSSVYMVTMHHRALFTSPVSDDSKHQASERLYYGIHESVHGNAFPSLHCRSSQSRVNRRYT